MSRHPQDLPTVPYGLAGLTTPSTASSSVNVTKVRWLRSDYHNPFRSQPWRFLWWLDDKGHQHLSRETHRRLCGPICDVLDGMLR